jgi:ubiquinone/menaquinone biosynthesis C-methylase UbiE
MRKNQHENAISWHSVNSKKYSDNYHQKRSFRERLGVWTQLIENVALPGFSVLDLGCGEGTITVQVAKKVGQVVAIDASTEMLEMASALAKRDFLTNIEFREEDLASLDFSEFSSVDLVMASSVFEYINDFEKLVGRASLCLRRQGLLVFSIPNGQSLLRMLERISFFLINRPHYLRFVKNRLSLKDIDGFAVRLALTVREVQFFGLGWRVGPGKATSLLNRLFQPMVLVCLVKSDEGDARTDKAVDPSTSY